jgi:hypothetical protein
MKSVQNNYKKDKDNTFFNKSIRNLMQYFNFALDAKKLDQNQTHFTFIKGSNN